MCGELGIPVLWHCGPVGIEPEMSRKLCQLKNYWTPIRECPETTFILGHAGALQMDMALELATLYSNVYVEISSQSKTSVETIIRKLPENKILFGSDWPFYHQAIPLSKVLLATENNLPLREKILWKNGADLLGLEYSGNSLKKIA